VGGQDVIGRVKSACPSVLRVGFLIFPHRSAPPSACIGRLLNSSTLSSNQTCSPRFDSFTRSRNASLSDACRENAAEAERSFARLAVERGERFFATLRMTITGEVASGELRVRRGREISLRKGAQWGGSLSGQADTFAGANVSERVSACSVRNDGGGAT
jgi:hypothetical protein